MAPLLPFGLKVPDWLFVFPVLMLLCLYLTWRSSYAAVTRLVLGSAAFTILFLLFSTYLLGANPLLTNSSNQLARVLQEKELQGRRVVVYDRLLPSLAFELNHNLVTVQDKSRSLDRETQFETDKKWEQHFLQLHQREDSTIVARLLQQHAVLLVKGDLPAARQWFIKHLHKKRSVGKWHVYY